MLASILHNRSLSLKDERFVDDLLTDLTDYLHRHDSYRVLLFPPLNGYKRLLIHQTVESEFSDLITFSIGTGTSRRTVVAFRIACSRGPSGIQLMSNPGSPTPKGRGRGRWKEMSSNERVANWVNQREAKRLNKERWANHTTGANSSTGDGDVQMPTKQEVVEPETSLDRSKVKRQNVPLYVPPSLRAKKESGTMKDPQDVNMDCSAAKGSEGGDKIQNGGLDDSPACILGTGSRESEGQQSSPRETSRSKGRGRGRKKPEVEIYVPRALRAVKHESKCVSRPQVCDEHRGLCTEKIQHKTPSADCNISMHSNVLPSKSYTQSPEFADALIPDEVSHNESQHCFSDELVHHYYAGDYLMPFGHDSVTKKGKYEPISDTSEQQYEPDTPVPSPLAHAISDELLHLNCAGKSLTFEFYDPAVVAFLPSTCSVLKPSDMNLSYSMGSTRQTQSAPQVSASLQQNVTVFSDSSISSDAHFQSPYLINEYQSQVSIGNNIEHSLSGVCEDTKKDSWQGKINSTDACINRSIPSFSSERVFTNDLRDSQSSTEPSEMLAISVAGNSGKPGLAVDNAAVVEIPDVLKAGSGNAAVVEIFDGLQAMSGSDADVEMPYGLQTGSDSAADIEMSDGLQAGSDSAADVKMPDGLQALSGSVEGACGNFSERISAVVHSVQQIADPCDNMCEKDMSLSVQQAVQTAKDEFEGEAYHSEKRGDGRTLAFDVSSNPAEDEGDSWDTLFDDNGDCLDDTVITELTEYVGKVEIDKPKINYLNYEPKDTEMNYEAFSHILEIYDFSSELATCDLITAFREFSSRGFDVKWVDDTHALGIFSSAIAAKEALRMVHPLLKVRPLSEASKKGQSKARHCQEFLQPYKARPETTSIAARRLVAGALGMMPQVSKEVRELERKKLKEAKERRRQERQQKIDIWDGSFKKCAADEDSTDSR
ncbi:hypothetical protein BsWGS_04270 [Bradybaena similaris]